MQDKFHQTKLPANIVGELVSEDGILHASIQWIDKGVLGFIVGDEVLAIAPIPEDATIEDRTAAFSSLTEVGMMLMGISEDSLIPPNKGLVN